MVAMTDLECEDTTFPSTMEIDHVKIWEWNNTGS